MIRVGVNPVIFLLNNATYVIEEEIHSGPYNKLANWDYTALITAMKDGSSNLYTAKARTPATSSPTLASFGFRGPSSRDEEVHVHLHIKRLLGWASNVPNKIPVSGSA